VDAVVSLEHRFDRTPDGAVWTQAAFGFSFWARYLEAFDAVRVVARVRDVPIAPQDHIRADGPLVSFCAVPYYRGPWEYIARSVAVSRTVRRAVRRENAVIMRVGSQLANCLSPHLRVRKHPYGVEVVCDPWDAFSPNSVRHLLRPVLRRYFTRCLQGQCRGACAAAYVTESALQKRYPAASGRFSTHYSSVELGSDSYVSEPRGPQPNGGGYRVAFVGSLDQLYKGQAFLLRAVAGCVRTGLDLQLDVIGDGRLRMELEQTAAALGIADRVVFFGQLLGGKAVREQLDRAHLFVLPSLSEGLPRALIEAMARGLPCVASSVGGIPELLPADDLVPPRDAAALATKLREVLLNPEQRLRMAKQNLSRARDFHEAALRHRRLDFFRTVREQTTIWLRQQRAVRARRAWSTGSVIEESISKATIKEVRARE
jgi:glycosyltransferase involved in cell wall biosynthesis